VISIDLPKAIEISGAHKRIAAVCQVDLGTVYRWVRGERPIPEARRPEIISAILAAGGDTPAVLRDMADLIEGLVGAEADGKISPAEAEMIECEGLRTILDIHRAICRARARAAQKP